MKLKVIAGCCAAALMLSACASNPQPDKPASPSEAAAHTLYVRDDFSSESIEARFFSTETGAQTTVPLKKIAEAKSYNTWSCDADPALYDRVVLTSDGESSVELAFNDYVSGWYLSSFKTVPFTYDDPWIEPKFETKLFDYEDDQKPVYIWTPSDYDANAAEPYSVIYMTDGQNLFSPSATHAGCWGVADSVTSMMKLSSNKAIVVGIDDGTSNRDSELTPNLGSSVVDSYNGGTGKYFSDFVVNTVVPYIEENYNVAPDPAHNAVCGSSSGGIECFYIGMEHPEKFGTIGALSPAFALYDTATWESYLGEKSFDDDSPFVYIYCGNSEADSLEQFLMEGAQAMPDTLKKLGYPEDKLVFKRCDTALHDESYWRAVFPDFLKYAFPK